MVLVMMHRPVEPRDDYILPRVVQRRQDGRGQEEADDAGVQRCGGVIPVVLSSTKNAFTFLVSTSGAVELAAEPSQSFSGAGRARA